jgi:hypothetical protein
MGKVGRKEGRSESKGGNERLKEGIDKRKDWNEELK